MELTQEDLKKLVAMIAEELNRGKTPSIEPEIPESSMKQGRAILTAIGIDRPGIVAGISTELANMGINILGISQTIVSEYFAMIMLLELKGASHDFETIKSRMERVGDNLGAKIILQKEEIFQFMHRI